jgi:hypothetical protein
MTIKELIDILNTAEDKSRQILVACDEEWNSIFSDVRLEETAPAGDIVLFGLSGSEKEI